MFSTRDRPLLSFIEHQGVKLVTVVWAIGVKAAGFQT